MAGYNPQHGYDSGPPPPGFPPTQTHGQYVPAHPAPWPPGYPQYVVSPGFVMAPGPCQQPHNAGFPPAFFPHAPLPPQPSVPGINFINHTGGIGLPSGYNYIFPQEHCKIYVLKTATPPWQQQGTLTHVKLLVPSSVTVMELMQNLGCNNPEPKKNKLYEVTEGGNGKWYKGISITGDEKDKVKKRIAEFGWDKSRTGNPGERSVVWLWCTKD